MSGKNKHQPWKIVKSKDIYNALPWIKLSTHQIILPNGQMIDNFHRIEMPEYVVVVAHLADGRIIMERQYKHGVGKPSLMLPAGVIEDGEKPLDAAQRELLEETGYVAEEWQFLGEYVVNASYGCGKAHIFMAQNVRLVMEPDSGDLEDIEVVLMQPKDALRAGHRGEVMVLSTAAAIALATNPLYGSNG